MHVCTNPTFALSKKLSENIHTIYNKALDLKEYIFMVTFALRGRVSLELCRQEKDIVVQRHVKQII